MNTKEQTQVKKIKKCTKLWLEQNFIIIFALKIVLSMAARLKKQDKSIIENMPVKSIQWIQQPHNLTFVKGEMTKQQLRVFVSLVEQLQSRIHDVVTAHFKGTQLSLFKDYEYDEYKRVSISIPLKDIASHTSHYKDIADAAEKLFSLVDRNVYIDEEGIEQVEYAHVIDKVVIPKDNTGRRKGNIVFKINKSMIESVFSLDRYVRYIKDVATDFQNPYAGRLYMFIEAYKEYGEWKVKYEELREILGCREWDKEKKEWIEKKHVEWRVFKNKILDTSKKELTDLAEKNVTDCYFDYIVEKKKGSTLAEAGPESIKFLIKKTKFGEEQEVIAADKQVVLRIENLLRNDLDLKTSAVVHIMKLIKSDNAEFILQKLEEIKYYVIANKTEIKKVKEYVYKAIKNALDERESSYTDFEEIKDDPVINSPTLSENKTPNPESEEQQIIDNRCTKAVKNFWEMRWPSGERQSKVKELNVLISTLDLGLKEDIPHYDISKLEGHLSLFLATCSQYPTSAVILDFIKTKEGIKIEKYGRQQTNPTAGQGYDRRRAAPISLDAPPEAYEKPKKVLR